MGEAMRDPSIILWSRPLSNRDVVGFVTMIDCLYNHHNDVQIYLSAEPVLSKLGWN